MWQQSTQQTVDGVIAIDPVFLQRMLAVSGPGDGGQRRDAGRYEHRAVLAQSGIHRRVRGRAERLFRRCGGHRVHAYHAARERPQGILNAVASSITDGHLKLWSAHQEEQDQLLTTPIAGALKTTGVHARSGGFTSRISARRRWTGICAVRSAWNMTRWDQRRRPVYGAHQAHQHDDRRRGRLAPPVYCGTVLG